jgi:hypothetical protein
MKLEFPCVVAKGLYDDGEKMDIRIHVVNLAAICNFQSKWTEKISGYSCFKNPLDGTLLTVKVPYRYGRISCTFSGSKTLYELKAGDEVKVTIESKGLWSVGSTCGFTWRLCDIFSF